MRRRGVKLRGRDRELDVVDMLRDADHVAYRVAHGPADVVAFGGTFERPLLVQVKSTSGGPYERFTPADRRALLADAARARADAVLCWWPAGVDAPKWIEPERWPALLARVA